jgi:pseudaminic acid biosynthesis-associated methylase
MNRQEELWAGTFGDEYTERNQYVGPRWKFWHEFVCRYGMLRVLEVGCNLGKNLSFIDNEIWEEFDALAEVYGIDVNWEALESKGARGRIYGKATDIPFKDSYFDLVFTCGLLIHVPPEDLLTVMGECVRTSRKYVMFMEYYAEEEEQVEYHGERDVLWKRPYKEIFLDNFSPHKVLWGTCPTTYFPAQCDIECIDEGFLGKDQGFDDVTWWLFECK